MSQTKYLKLNKHDNVETNQNKFDIENYMNVNWDVIDEEAEKTANQVKTDASNIETNTESINSIKQEQIEQNNRIQANEEKIALTEEDIKELQEENKALKEDMDAISIRGQATGENLTLEDSSNARFDKFVVSGNSWQETREGKNILNPDIMEISGTKAGLDWNYNKNTSELTLNRHTYRLKHLVCWKIFRNFGFIYFKERQNLYFSKRISIIICV